MKEGKVKFLNKSKGFGFMKDTETGKEYFFDVSDCKEEVQENDDVTFELQEGKRGLNAVNIRLL